MARVKFSPFIASVNGSMGGITFQRSNAGFMLRSKASGNNRSTSGQQVAKNNMRLVLDGWRALSNADRIAWQNSVAFFSPTVRRDRQSLLTGYQLYLRYNLLRLSAFPNDLGVINDAPTFNSIADTDIDVTLTRVNDTSFTAAFAGGIDTDERVFLLKLSNILPDGKSKAASALRAIRYSFSTAGSKDIYNSWNDVYNSNTPSSGSRLFVEMTLFHPNSPAIYRKQQFVKEVQ